MTASRPDALSTIPGIDVLDRLDPDAFEAALGPLFEGAPAFLGRLADARPFGSIEAMFAAARSIAHSMPEAAQVELVDAHPRLGAPPGSVSALSFREQGYDRDATAPVAAADPVDAAEAERVRLAAELDRLNAAYEARFGFRYCIFVAGRPREALLPGLAAALESDRGAELDRALDAVIDIALDRYRRAMAFDVGDGR